MSTPPIPAAADPTPTVPTAATVGLGESGSAAVDLVVRPKRKSPRLHRERIQWIRDVVAEVGEGCRDWPWSNTRGYGRITYLGRDTQVGHLALEFSGRPRPSMEFQQLHSCDRPPCFAPWHLRWGTAQENVNDCIERGRTRCVTSVGEHHGSARLTEADVLYVRASSLSNVALGRELSVSGSLVSKIRKGQRWAYLLGVSA